MSKFFNHAIALIALGLALASPVTANALTLGEPAPPLTLHTLDGKTISTRDLLGQVVIVTFWATWCSPCQAELPLLSAYAKRHAGDGLQILGFSLDGSDDLRSVHKLGASFDFPVGLLGNPWAGAYGRIWRVPVSFVIDRNGRLAYNGWEAQDPVWSEDELRRVIDPLLAMPGR